MHGMSCRMQDEIVLSCVSLVPVTCRPDTAWGCTSTAAAHNRGWTKGGTHTKEGPPKMALQNSQLQGRDMACIYPKLSSFLTPLQRCQLKLGTAVLPVLAWLQSSAAGTAIPPSRDNCVLTNRDRGSRGLPHCTEVLQPQHTGTARRQRWREGTPYTGLH
jgi:hypothetical protein